ncbi:MAG TPA: prephenate dehydrogenase [Chloroflexia bacterium]|nr:prephenate dehydrogenase [Chloroflexia bacterium]
MLPTPEPERQDATWLAGAEVAIVGLGLMGGSLAGALRGAGAAPRACRRVVGIVRRAETVAAAGPWVDTATADLAAVGTADVVILAVPPRTILQLLPIVAAQMRPGALLTDLGSTKSAIVEVMSSSPAGLLLAGGHPMCGKEAGGLAAADPQLYRGAPYLICPVPSRPAAAVAHTAALARALGAQPRVLDPATHDQLVAAISHVPYTGAVALVLAAAQLDAPTGGAIWELVAGGFRDTTRVAAGELDMWIDILLTNRAEVLAHLQRLTGVLTTLATALAAEDTAALGAALGAAQERRRRLFRA